MNIDIDNETATKLDAIAKSRHMSVSDLLRNFAQEQVAFFKEKQEDEHIWELAKNGDYVDNAAVMEWLESWGSDTELPCPSTK